MMGACGKVAALALALVLAVLSPQQALGVNCTARQECDPRSRRILFILDASLSIDQARFDDQMMEFVINTFCGFRNNALGAKYEAGVITFNQFIQTKIPFTEFTPDGFEAAINEKVRYKTPLRCCTSHSESAVLAREMFEAAAALDAPGTTPEMLAYIVTDGRPYPNYLKGTYGIKNNNVAKAFYTSRGLKIADWTQGQEVFKRDEERVHYATVTVPTEVKALKDMGARVFFIGVPHSEADKGVNIDFFNGKDTEICYENTDVKGTPQTSCGTQIYSPLVSEPVDDHAFRVENWDLDPLVTEALDKICKPWSPPTVCNNVSRDLMIMVDTSDSMDEARFKNEMMRVVRAAASNVDRATSRVGVATFGAKTQTRVQIPLQVWPSAEAFDAELNATVRDLPMACCTNFGESFDNIQRYFRNNFMEGQDKVLLVISDGTPFQNFGPSKWEWKSNQWDTRINRCEYATSVVPGMATSLKADGVRIVLAGVPNKEGRAPMQNYFTGSLVGERCCVNSRTNQACLIDGSSEWCTSSYSRDVDTKCFDYDNSTIVSQGSGNIFTSLDWDVTDLNTGIKNMLCNTEAYATPPPTVRAPTPPPTEARVITAKPTVAPPAVAGFDLVIVLDTSAKDAAQSARCIGTFLETACHDQLTAMAKRLRNRMQSQMAPGALGLATVASSCYETSSWDWTRTNQGLAKRVVKLRNAKQGGPQCGTAGLLAAQELVEARADQSRGVAVVYLTHHLGLSDQCAALDAAGDVRALDGVSVYVGTVGAISGAHQTLVTNIAGNANRVYSALAEQGIDDIVQDLSDRFAL